MRRLFILRPEPAASATVSEAAELGLDAIALPLFKVQPMPWAVPELGDFDALLLTSVNAVRHGGHGLGQLRRLPVHSVGEVTAKAARDAGFEIASTGQAGVGRLLGSIEPDLRLLHLCGAHRTPVQASQEITAIPVYRAAELPVPALTQVEGQVVAVHSPRAAQYFAEIAEQQQIDRSAIRIAAISDAAGAAAGSGWQACEAADRPDGASLLALAARLCEDRARA